MEEKEYYMEFMILLSYPSLLEPQAIYILAAILSLQ